jgi:hypothetical protein
MSTRVLNRQRARELAVEELNEVAGASTGCFLTVTGVLQSIDDHFCGA